MNDGALEFDVIVRTGLLDRGLRQAEQRVLGFTQRVQVETTQVDDTFNRISRTAAGLFAFTQLSQLPGQIVKVRGEFQQLGITLETILGSKSEADKLFAESVQLAAKTPFNLRDVGQGAKQLLAYGFASDEVTDTLRRLGDVASGLSIPLNDLTYLYGTTRTQGRLYAQDLNQFVGRGIPLISGLAKELNVAESEIRGMVEAGRVGFPEVQKVINELTSEGGKFFNLMEKNSKSLTGLTSNLEDAFSRMFNEIGESNQDFLQSVLEGSISAVENYQKIVDVIGILIATYGAYKAATLTVVVANRLIAASSTATLFLEMAKGLGTVTAATYVQATAIGVQTRAQATLNAVMALNPYVAAVTGIVALVGGLYLLNQGTTAAEEAQKSFTDALESDARAKDELSKKTRELTGIISSETSTKYAQVQAYAALKALYPKLLQNISLQEFQTLKTTEAQRMLNRAMDEFSINQTADRYEGAKKKVQEYEAQLGRLIDQQKLSGMGGAGLVVPIEELRKKLQAARLEAEKYGQTVTDNEAASFEANATEEEKTRHYQDQLKSLQEQRSSVEESITKTKTLGGVIQGIKPFLDQLTLTFLNDQIDKLISKLPTLSANDGGNKSYWEKQKAESEQALEAMGVGAKGSGKWNQLVRDIQKAEIQLKKYSTTVKTSSAKVPEKDKPQPFGSIAYYEQIARKAQDVIDVTSSANIEELNRQTAIKAEAERRAEEIRKQFTIKSFSDELQEKRAQYELYQKWVDNLGKEAADRQFSELVKGGTSFAAYLQNQIAQLQTSTQGGGLITSDAQQLIELTDTLAKVTNQATPLEAFRTSIDNITQAGRSLTVVLDELNQKQQDLQSDTNQADYYEKAKITAEKILEVERQRQGQLDDFLQAVEGSEQKRATIAAKYADLRAAAAKRYTDQESESYLVAMERINAQEQYDLDESKRVLFEKSKAYQDLFSTILERGQEALKIRITQYDIALEKAKSSFGTESEEYKKLLKEKQDATEQFNAQQLRTVALFARIGGELGSILSDSNGALGQTGRLLSGIAGEMNNVLVAFDKSASESDRIAAGVQGLVNLIGIAVSSARQRRDAEADYYRSVISFQQEYNLLLNEQMGIRAEASEGIFFTDYVGRIQDGITKYADAQTKYEESVAKLTAGRVKNGQKNGVDFGAVGQGAGSGAAIGAAVGTIVPIIGTAIGAGVGAIVGGLVGLFAGKKKKDTFVGILEAYPNLIRTAADGTQSLNAELAQALLTSGQLDDETKQLVQNTLDWQKAVEEAQEQINGVIKDLAGSLGNDLGNALVEAFKTGEDAARLFGQSVSQVIENMIKQLVTAQLFGPVFDQLADDIKASYGTGGDGTILDDLGRLFQSIPPLVDDANKAFSDAKGLSAQYGLDVFGNKPVKSASDANNLSGAIRGMSEETAGILAGQFNAIRINGAETTQLTRQSLLHLSEIATNTRYNRHLVSIDKTLKDIQASDPLRATGLPK